MDDQIPKCPLQPRRLPRRCRALRQAHFNLGMTLLQLGDYERGFAEYEWRWRTGQFTPFACPHPKWDGRPIPGKTLLVHTEQGAGDAVQFARFLPLAAQRCATLLLVCRLDLQPLLATASGVASIRGPGQIGVSEFDTYIPLLSLPHVLGTTLATVPASVPYVGGEGLRREKLKPELTLARRGRPMVGIAWAGSPTHRNDRRRSCPLTALVPLLRTPGVDFYSLQKGDRSRDLGLLPRDVEVRDMSSRLGDFGDLAVVIEQLDLVISVDTAVAHVAGALGKPVWLLLSYHADWRWLMEGERTPWYPTMRLFRQSRPAGWPSVVSRVARELEPWFASRGGQALAGLGATARQH